MILGDVCTRSCTFCAVRSGRPDPADADEPARVADAVNRLGLRHVVITSVTRDDLPDGGAHLFAEAVVAIRRQCPGTGIELLIPDFQGDPQALAAVVATHPDVLNHNVETIPRLYPQVRPQASFDRSIELLHRARQLHPPMLTKSGIMVGLGEERGEVVDCLKRIRNSGCDILTMGQYLRPSKAHHPVIRYYHPDEFADLRTEALALGFRHVESGPLVRSSYHAWDQFRSAETDGRPQAIPPSRSGDGTTSTSE
jgi:lipoic acid synthetase